MASPTRGCGTKWWARCSRCSSHACTSSRLCCPLMHVSPAAGLIVPLLCLCAPSAARLADAAHPPTSRAGGRAALLLLPHHLNMHLHRAGRGTARRPGQARVSPHQGGRRDGRGAEQRGVSTTSAGGGQYDVGFSVKQHVGRTPGQACVSTVRVGSRENGRMREGEGGDRIGTGRS